VGNSAANAANALCTSDPVNSVSLALPSSSSSAFMIVPRYKVTVSVGMVRVGAFILGWPAKISAVDTPVGQLMNIVVDCPDADISARFWAAVLGWERVQENADFVDIADASDGRRRLVFQQIADYRPPGWPDQGPPQQLHLDVRVDDLEIAEQRVRALGAVPLAERVVLEDESYRVYADPAGHPFCLVQLETT
jgi:catechol 2,3-dioxygenase-like lactoylglutathione lyase family enzyme